MLLPIAPHGAPGLESETPEGKPAPEQGRLFAGQPRIKASALQQAFEDGHVVDVEAGNALRFGIKQSPEPRRGDEALCRRLAESHALPAHGGGQMRQRRGGQEVEGILEAAVAAVPRARPGTAAESPGLRSRAI